MLDTVTEQWLDMVMTDTTTITTVPTPADIAKALDAVLGLSVANLKNIEERMEYQHPQAPLAPGELDRLAIWADVERTRSEALMEVVAYAQELATLRAADAARFPIIPAAYLD